MPNPRARTPGSLAALARDDRNPSLSIGLGDDGRALLLCHAGCTVQEIVGAMNLELSDLFADNGDWREKG